MGKNTDISWTDHTWNPWQGCRKVSPGCKNCYMFRDKKRYGQDSTNIHQSTQATFNKPLTWKDPAKVFVCSWSDFFIEEADAWRPEAWEIIRQTPHLTYQILTKRSDRIKQCLPKDWPLKNVWLGVTTEDQEQAMQRILDLLSVEAEVHFVSAEPLLEEIDITEISLSDDITLYPFTGKRKSYYYNQYLTDLPENKIDWVICGGESGGGFRQMDPDWANELRGQCLQNNTPFFMKQMSGVHPKKIQLPWNLDIKEFPKAGR